MTNELKPCPLDAANFAKTTLQVFKNNKSDEFRLAYLQEAISLAHELGEHNAPPNPVETELIEALEECAETLDALAEIITDEPVEVHIQIDETATKAKAAIQKAEGK